MYNTGLKNYHFLISNLENLIQHTEYQNDHLGLFFTRGWRGGREMNHIIWIYFYTKIVTFSLRRKWEVNLKLLGVMWSHGTYHFHRWIFLANVTFSVASNLLQMDLLLCWWSIWLTFTYHYHSLIRWGNIWENKRCCFYRFLQKLLPILWFLYSTLTIYS